MNLLLDTHVLLWAATDNPRLGQDTRDLMASAHERHVSAASASEIAMRARIGKLPHGRAVLDGWTALLRNLQAVELPLTGAHMARAGDMQWEHRDPFDRMLVAQSQLEGLALLTDDRATRAYADVRTVWGSV